MMTSAWFALEIYRAGLVNDRCNSTLLRRVLAVIIRTWIVIVGQRILLKGWPCPEAFLPLRLPGAASVDCFSHFWETRGVLMAA